MMSGESTPSSAASAAASANSLLACAVYRLSEVELRVAEALVLGDFLAGCAERLDLSINTVKSHLAIFEKTQTERQADLVRGLLQLSR